MIAVIGIIRMVLGVITVHHLAFFRVIYAKADGSILFYRTLDIVLRNPVDA